MMSKHDADKKNEEIEIPVYPEKINRYSHYWWNRNVQYCYTDEDLLLLQRIQAEHKALPETSKREDYFALMDEKKWNDWWHCKKPSSNPARLGSESRSFTLPSRESKDTKTHPLWSYADSMARQIANWQAERSKNQNLDLINDPVMLALEELKYWFFYELSEKECKIEDTHFIAARQSYINKLIYMIPNFGPDRLHLRHVQQSLEEASKIVINCVANKELPHLLSDLISHGKSLETAVGTYLHFLLSNEEVSENFSHDYIEEGNFHCKLSPVCKMYKAASIARDSDCKEDKVIASYQKLNKFYEILPVEESDEEIVMQIKLKEHLLKEIKFASFVTEEIKIKYLEAMVTLESLVNVRKVLEKFQNILPRVGTYMFAVSYLENVDTLSMNYINLVNKARHSIGELIVVANKGLTQVLSNPAKLAEQNKWFEKNLRALETNVAEKTTVLIQLESYSKKATESMNKYQQEMKKLVAHLHSGAAASELELAMQEVILQINHLNIMIPAQLTQKDLATLPRVIAMHDSKSLAPPSSHDIVFVQTSGADRVKPSGIFSGFGVLGDIKKIAQQSYHTIASQFKTSKPNVSYLPDCKSFESKACVSLSATTGAYKPHFSVTHDEMSLAYQSGALAAVTTASPFMLATGAQHYLPVYANASMGGGQFQEGNNQLLSVVQNTVVAKTILHYASRCSLFTLPWSKQNTLNLQQKKELNEYKKNLVELGKTFEMQKTSAAAKSGLYSDRYYFVDKTIFAIQNEIHILLSKNKGSEFDMSQIRNKLMRIKEVMHDISLKNRELKKWVVKNRK